jgi:hypothetical protein
LLPFVSQTLLYKKTLYSNPYRNAGELQRKTIARNEQNRAVSSTKRTRANTSEQRKSSPPFGMPSIFFEPYHNSSKDTGGLRRFHFHLYTATVQEPNYLRSKVDAEMHNRNRAKSLKGSMLLAADERSKRQLLFSRFLVRMLMDN